MILDHLIDLCIFSFQDDSRRTASNAVTEPGPPAMPRLPSCCPQHSPCGGSSQNHHALGHPHTSCFQQHGHHFQHHHHHHHTPHPAVPVSPSFSDPTCPVERPPQVQPPCGANSTSSTSYHDQVCGIWWVLLNFLKLQFLPEKKNLMIKFMYQISHSFCPCKSGMI